jgi:hypothetical protein
MIRWITAVSGEAAGRRRMESAMGWDIKNILCGDDFLGYSFKSNGGSFSAAFCSELQQKVVAKSINVPGRPYVSAQSYQDILKLADDDGFVSSGADSGSRQCVALVKAAIPGLGPATNNWCKGEAVDNDNVADLLPGTAIGYGFGANGLYLSNTHGNHVAIFVSAKDGDVKILDQWYSNDDKYQEASVHTVDLAMKSWSIVTRAKPKKK